MTLVFWWSKATRSVKVPPISTATAYDMRSPFVWRGRWTDVAAPAPADQWSGLNLIVSNPSSIVCDMDHLRSMRAFVAVTQNRSFAVAAERLRVTPSLVSKQIADLERRLGVRLLNRTTRRVGITDI